MPNLEWNLYHLLPLLEVILLPLDLTEQLNRFCTYVRLVEQEVAHYCDAQLLAIRNPRQLEVLNILLRHHIDLLLDASLTSIFLAFIADPE